VRKNIKLEPFAIVKNIQSKTRQDLEGQSDEQKEVKDMG
jgi:hypothetical protein